MRRYILNFRRGDEFSAELHLDIDSSSHSVEALSWYGDPRANELIGPFPKLRSTYHGVWLSRARKAAHHERLVLTVRYEGEPLLHPGGIRGDALKQRELHNRYLAQGEENRQNESEKQ